MSFTMHGIPVSGGIAIGHAHLVSHARFEVAHYGVPQYQLAGEIARFDTDPAQRAAGIRGIPQSASDDPQ
jgi:phosphoenolpyruvate-protein phosphotransferase (PTS system enzyme I)